MAATSLGKTLEIRDRLPRLELSHEDDLKLRATRGEAGGFYDGEIEVMTEVSVDRRAWTGALMVERSQIERGHWTPMERPRLIPKGRCIPRIDLLSGYSNGP
ncbi:hypothetical protein YC2023_078613 [Brassica napus]